MAVEEESVLFAYEGDGSSAMATLDELDAGMQSLFEVITQASEVFASFAESLDAMVGAAQSAAEALSSVATAAAGIGDAAPASAAELETSLAGIDEAALSAEGALAGLDEVVSGTDAAFASSSMALVVWQESAANVEMALTTLDAEFMAAEEAMAAAAAGADILEASFTVLSETLAAAGEAEAGVVIEMEAVATAAQSAAASVETLNQSLATNTGETKNNTDAHAGQEGQLLMVAAVAVMAAGKFLDMGSKAEDAFAQIQGLAGASASQMEGYKSSLESMAVQFGTTLDQAANGLYFVISAGFSGASAMTVLGNAMKASSASGAMMADTSKALVAILNGYAAGADQAQKYTDYMTTAVIQGTQTYGEFAGAIGAAATTGHAVGISFDQVAAAEATLTRSGFDAHRAVQDLDFMLRAVALGGGAKAEAAAKSLKLSFDATAYASMPLIDKLNYLEKISNGNQVAFTKLVGGANGFLAAQSLMTDETGKYNQILDAMHHSLGATDAAFQTTQQTISAALGHVQGALSVVAYQLVELIQPAVSAGLNGLAGAFQFIGAHIQQFQPIIAGLAAFFVSVFIPVLVGMAAPIVAAFAPFALAAGLIGGAVAALLWLNNTFPAFHAALASVGAAFDAFADKVRGVFDAVARVAQEQTLRTKISTIETTIAQKQALVASYQQQADQIEQTLLRTHNNVERQSLMMRLKAVQEAEAQAQGVIQAAQKQRAGVEAQLAQTDPVVALHALKQKDVAVSQSLQQSQQTLINMQRTRQGLEIELANATTSTQRHALQMQISAVDAAIKQKEGVIKAFEGQKQGIEKQMKDQQAILSHESFGSALIAAWKAIQTAAGQVGAFFTSHILPILAAVGSFIAAQFIPLWKQLQDLWNQQLLPSLKQLWQAVQPLLPVFKDLAMLIGVLLVGTLGILIGLITGIATAIANGLSGLMNIFGGIVRFITGIVQVVSGILRFIDDLFHGHFSKLGADLGQIWEGIKNIFFGALTAIAGFFQTIWGVISGLVGGFVQGIITFFKHLFDQLVGHSIIPDLINGIIQWFLSLPGKVLGALASFVGGVLGKIGELKDRAIAAFQNMVSGILGQTNEMRDKVALDHEQMRLKSEDQTITMARTNISHLEKEKQGILAQLKDCKDQSQRNRLEMRLKAIDNAEKQQQAIITAAQKEKEQTLQHIRQLHDQMIQDHKNIFEKCWDFIRNLVGNIFSAIGTFVHNCLTKIGEWRDTFVSLVSNMKDRVIHEVQNLISNIASFFSSLPGKALQWGEDMINGFISGISSKIGALGNMIGNIGSMISSNLHFSVPEEGPLRDADQWMPDMMDLFTQGITSNQDKVKRAVQGLSQTLSGALHTSLPSLNTPGNPQGGGSSLFLPSLVPQSGGGAGGFDTNPQTHQLLAQILAVLQRQANTQQTTISNTNTIHAPGSDPQGIYNFLQSLGGYQYTQSLQRGALGI